MKNQLRNAQKDISSIKLTDQLKPVPTRSSDYPLRSQLPNTNFVSKPTDIRKLSHNEITEPTPSDLTPKTPFSLEQKNKYSLLVKTDAETTEKPNSDPKTNQNIRIDNGRNRWPRNKLLKLLCPPGLPQTLSILSKPETHDSKSPTHNKENKCPIHILSDSLSKGIKPRHISHETYTNKQCISGGNVTDLSKIVNNMDDQTRYRKALPHLGTNNVFK